MLLPFLLVVASHKISFLHDHVSKKFKLLMMEASVMMKEDKNMKIKTFRAGYAWSMTAFFCTDGFAVCSDGFFCSDGFAVCSNGFFWQLRTF